MGGHNGCENHLCEHEARWFAVCTKYKREKLVHKRLEDRGIESYLPLQKFIRRSTRKIRKVELPLISRYIFTRIVKKEYIPVLDTPDVTGFVHFSNSLIAIPEQEIALLKRIVGEGFELEATPINFVQGDEVEVIAGKLTGLRGVLLEKENKHHFLVELRHIGYALHIQIDPELLRRVGHSEHHASLAPPTKFEKWGLTL
jgi:transcription antitermination factor NusG